MWVVWAVLLALGLWWLTTILLLWRLRQPVATFRTTFLVVSMFAGLAVVGFVWSLGETTAIAAIVGFGSGLAFWCWHETAYLLGYLSGPRPAACPPGANQWQRFHFGVQASLYHELAVIATAVAMLALSTGASNLVAVQTFVVLWIMRWSTKINIFLGVRNLHVDFWPTHLRYLGTYASPSPTNRFFPISGVLAISLALWIVFGYGDQPASDFRLTAMGLVMTLLALACLEHVFLMVKVPDHLLWQWGLAPAEPARVSARAALVNSKD